MRDILPGMLGFSITTDLSFSLTEPQKIQVTNVESHSLELWSLPNLRWLVVLKKYSGQVVKVFESQPLHFDRPKDDQLMFITAIVQWSAVGIELYINGQQVLSSGATRKPLAISIQTRPLGQPIPSVDNNDASTACASWISWRNTWLPTLKPLSGRQAKTIDELANELSQSSAALAHFSEEIRNGKHFLLPPLAAALRASIYWKVGEKNKLRPSYNPLLLRMAQIGNLALPVYGCTRVESDAPPGVLQVNCSIHAVSPQLLPTPAAVRLMDIQESLNGIAIFFTPGTHRPLRALEIISEVANTAGAHYDAGNSLFLDPLLKTWSTNLGMLTDFMVETSDTVAGLGVWVLQQLRLQGKIK